MNDEIKDDSQPIDFKRVIVILLRYKVLIAVITIIFGMISGYNAYFKPSQYRAISLVEIKIQEKFGSSGDLITTALGGGVKDYGRELGVIKSKYMANKAIKNLELGTRYFTKKKYKVLELYKNSPFVVNVDFIDKSLYGKHINLIPITKEKFKLEIVPTISKWAQLLNTLTFRDKPIIFSEEYEYGEEVNNKWFKLKIQKIHDMKLETYYFSYVPNKDMTGMITGGLDASFTSTEGIIKISFVDVVPKRAQDILIAVTNTYVTDQFDREQKTANRTMSFIDNQLKELTKVLSKSADKLKSFKQKESVVDLKSSAADASSRLTESKAQLKELELQESILSSLLDYIKNNENLDSISISTNALTNQSIYETIAKHHELSKTRRDTLISVTEFHPDVVSMNEEMRLLRDSLKYMIISTSKNLKMRIESLRENMAQYKKDLYAIPQKAGTLATLNRSYAINEKIYTFLSEKRIETAIVNSTKIENVRIMETAEVPRFSFKPNRKFMIMTGLIIGFIVGSVLAFILYFRDYTIKDIEEVEAVVKIPFFGLIPQLIKGKYTIAYEEAFRTLRTNLEFVKVNKNSKIILVASAISGEGKSTTIKNLAEMLVKLNRKTIVLDFDLRRPSIHEYFSGIENSVGLSMLLSAQCNLQESVQRTSAGVDIISAGPTPPNPSELIMSDASNLLLKTLSSTYDYILIDSPPYSIVTDANILMKKADITLFSIMLGQTKRDTVKKLDALVEYHEIKSAGIIYNGVKLNKMDKHGYGYFS